MTYLHMHDGQEVYYEHKCPTCQNDHERLCGCNTPVADIPYIPQANLGCATTGQILDELRARIEIDGRINYRTIDHD